MIFQGTKEQEFLRKAAATRAAGKKCVPVVASMPDDLVTPVTAYLTLREESVPSYLYESATQGTNGRYSYLGFAPHSTINCQNGQITIERGLKRIAETRSDDCLRDVLVEEVERFSVLPDPSLPFFTGGLVGGLGYETASLVEPTVPMAEKDDLGLPDITLMHYDFTVVFDHFFKTIYLIKLITLDPGGDEGKDLENLYQVQDYLGRVHDSLMKPGILELACLEKPSKPTFYKTQKEYMEMVQACKDYILAGDIFQAVVSQRFSCPLVAEPFVIYRHLRRTNPSPFLFFLDFGDYQMVGSSPEIMVEVKDRQVLLRPIAGTRKRGDTPEEDRRLEQELLADQKERAEHIMLVDLGRNDVGRVAVPGSVIVPEDRCMTVDLYSSVMHIVSDVRGVLREDLHPIDALLASLPAGTLSGAPKIRAMQIIAELEGLKRGPYGGCVGFFGYGGHTMETAITIRTAVVTENTIYWQAGGGVVHDSDPYAEYVESMHKGRAIAYALELSGHLKGGLIA